ncbi:MAG: hypothetical protein E7K72_14825 [Roseomonas mucosa]|uniref:hypothetical protein n=1 Tax=Roseomonas mucosa TaxID=207340 RepID=UPI001EF44F98|nr:hypothetical protein [Roseomonas mucosa]MCG7354431.1 hypothetical protein [Roseomonas mucosa]MDU7522640.1 hypothetical protein [Roseomonas mucosa]
MLDEPILVLETRDGTIAATLPETLARLCDGSLLGFDGLLAHQLHAWELFLYQLTALALLLAGEEQAAEDDAAWRALADPAAWRSRLAALTPGAETAWSPIVADLTRPAFLQPPIPSGRLDGYAVAGRTPDEIDLLITAKVHDVKAARLADSAPRHWCFALVSLQTQQGYSGRGNFGIARMNGGFGSRPMAMVTPGRSLAARFRRGVQAALAARSEVLENPDGLFSRQGTGLLWLLPWDREDSIALRTLDPLFIEVCRRLRLTAEPDGNILAWGRPSEVPRVAVLKELKGHLGDAWTPVAVKDAAALTVGGGGFDYRMVGRLLNREEFHLPVGMQAREGDPPDDTWLRLSVLVRGQGKTEGLHERWERIPPAARRGLGKASLGKISGLMLKPVEDAKKALSFGLRLFVQGAPEKLKRDDDRPKPILDAFEQRVDAVFLEHLFGHLTASEDGDPGRDWTEKVVALAREAFAEGQARLSPPDSRRDKARAVSGIAFQRSLRKAGLIQTGSESDE